MYKIIYNRFPFFKIVFLVKALNIIAIARLRK